MTEIHRRGIIGERMAQKYLVQQGYVILATHYRTRRGEIDCICLLDGALIAVEVKTRSDTSQGHPYQSVNRQKRFKILQTLYAYINAESPKYISMQIDVISISINPITHKVRLKHFKNIDL